jgi:hypothetical protein
MEATGANEVHVGTAVQEQVQALYLPERLQSYTYSRVSSDKVAEVLRLVGAARLQDGGADKRRRGGGGGKAGPARQPGLLPLPPPPVGEAV